MYIVNLWFIEYFSQKMSFYFNFDNFLKLKDNIFIVTINRVIQRNHWNLALPFLQAWMVLVEIWSTHLLKVLKYNIIICLPFFPVRYYKQKFMWHIKKFYCYLFFHKQEIYLLLYKYFIFHEHYNTAFYIYKWITFEVKIQI